MNAQGIAEIKELYDVDEHRIVRSLGKFEGGWYPTIYYWQLAGEGGEDDLLTLSDETCVSVFAVSEEDVELIPDLAEFSAVAIREDDLGFVEGKYYISAYDLYQDWKE